MTPGSGERGSRRRPLPAAAAVPGWPPRPSCRQPARAVPAPAAGEGDRGAPPSRADGRGHGLRRIGHGGWRKLHAGGPPFTLSDRDLLSGEDSKAFLEGAARRARKYRGALVTGTRNVNDYCSNPAARAAWENSG